MSAISFIDVWLLDCERPSAPDTREVVPFWLTETDKARLEHMRHPRRRREFLLGRCLLRHALQTRFGIGSHAWSVQLTDKGRPYLQGLQGSPASSDLPSVSLSHCHTLVACAVSSVSRIGLDVECLGQRKADFAALAATVFHPLERENMAKAQNIPLESSFLRHWTLKEALSKALGVGLALPMRQYAFIGDKLVAAPVEFGDVSAWRFRLPPYRDDIRLALAWEATGSTDPDVILKPVAIQNLIGE